MTEMPNETDRGPAADTMEFWREQAQLLKETADLSWRADLNVMQQARLSYSPYHGRMLRYATEELGIELNLLYRYLISMAIQYLAIGLLVEHNPGYFLQQPPGNRIVSLLQASKVRLTAQQEQLLRQSESANDWAARYPAGADDMMHGLAHHLSQTECLNREQKRALDELYEQLRRMTSG